MHAELLTLAKVTDSQKKRNSPTCDGPAHAPHGHLEVVHQLLVPAPTCGCCCHFYVFLVHRHHVMCMSASSSPKCRSRCFLGIYVKSMRKPRTGTCDSCTRATGPHPRPPTCALAPRKHLPVLAPTGDRAAWQPEVRCPCDIAHLLMHVPNVCVSINVLHRTPIHSVRPLTLLQALAKDRCMCVVERW